MKMEPTDQIVHDLTTHCTDCEQPFGERIDIKDGKEIKTTIVKNRHHDHLTGFDLKIIVIYFKFNFLGKYLSALCSRCNLNKRNHNNIYVYAHNLEKVYSFQNPYQLS